MTASDVIASVRHELNDEDAGNYRWDDVRMLKALTAALGHVRLMRPDLFLSDEDTMAAIPEYTAMNQTVSVDVVYELPVAWVVCAIVLAGDGDDAANEKRADGYMVKAMNRLMGTPA